MSSLVTRSSATPNVVVANGVGAKALRMVFKLLSGRSLFSIKGGIYGAIAQFCINEAIDFVISQWGGILYFCDQSGISLDTTQKSGLKYVPNQIFSPNDDKSKVENTGHKLCPLFSTNKDIVLCSFAQLSQGGTQCNSDLTANQNKNLLYNTYGEAGGFKNSSLKLNSYCAPNEVYYRSSQYCCFYPKSVYFYTYQTVPGTVYGSYVQIVSGTYLQFSKDEITNNAYSNKYCVSDVLNLLSIYRDNCDVVTQTNFYNIYGGKYSNPNGKDYGMVFGIFRSDATTISIYNPDYNVSDPESALKRVSNWINEPNLNDLFSTNESYAPSIVNAYYNFGIQNMLYLALSHRDSTVAFLKDVLVFDNQGNLSYNTNTDSWDNFLLCVNFFYIRALDFLWDCTGTSWPQWDYIYAKSKTPLTTFLTQLLGSNYTKIIPETVSKYINNKVSTQAISDANFLTTSQIKLGFQQFWQAFKKISPIVLCALAHSDDANPTSNGIVNGTYTVFLQSMEGSTGLYNHAPDNPYFGYITSFGGNFNLYYARVACFLSNCDGTSWPHWEYIQKWIDHIDPYCFNKTEAPNTWTSLAAYLTSKQCYSKIMPYWPTDQKTKTPGTQYNYLGSFLCTLMGAGWYQIVPQKVLDYFNAQRNQQYAAYAVYKNMIL